MKKIELVTQNESFYLASILKDPTLIDEAELLENEFIEPRNKELYKAMLELKREGEDINPLTLTQLGESRVARFGGTHYLSEILGSLPSSNAFKNYEKNIKDFHTIEKAQQIASDFLNNTTETYHTKELSKMINDITKLEASTVKKNKTFKELLHKRYQEHIESPLKGLSGTDTGFTSLNKFTDGWQHSDLIIVGARPSMGKTALVLNSLLNACEKGNVMGTLFSIEMAEEQIVDRLIAIKKKINLMKMRNPNKTFDEADWKKHSEAIGELERLSLDIRGESTVPAIRAALRRNVRENPDKKHIAAIDFLTLIRPVQPTGNTHTDITEIILELKQTAKDLKIPIIALAQLSRGIEQRQDKRPTMSDLRESGSIEQTADVIAFLYRDDYYHPETEKKGITEIIIGKNRNGATGTVQMKFFKETNVFNDIYNY